MKASVGDRIVMAGEQVDRPTRDGEVLEVRGANGAPPRASVRTPRRAEWRCTDKHLEVAR